MKQDRILVNASSLTYKTILSIVPTVAIGLALLKAFGGFAGPESPVVRFIARLLMPPEQADLLADQIIEFTTHISFGAIGGVSLTFLVLVAVSLLDTIDETFNHIWRVQRQRSMFFRFTTFYTLLTLGPLLLSVSLLQSARLTGLLPGGLLSKVVSFYTPLLFTWITLLLSYKLFPNTRVHWRPVAFGALVAALGIEGLKLAFNLYLSESMSTSYTTIYGALALIPLFLVWLYTIWTIVLFGVTYSHMLQTIPRWQQRHPELVRLGPVEKPQQVPVGEHLACRILLMVARAFAAGSQLPTQEELATQLHVEEAAVDIVVEPMLRQGWLRRIRECTDGQEREALLPGKGLQQIRLAEVVGSFRSASRSAGRGLAGEPLERWLEELDEALASLVKDTTLAELAGKGGALPAPPAEPAPAAAPPAPASSAPGGEPPPDGATG